MLKLKLMLLFQIISYFFFHIIFTPFIYADFLSIKLLIKLLLLSSFSSDNKKIHFIKSLMYFLISNYDSLKQFVFY